MRTQGRCFSVLIVSLIILGGWVLPAAAADIKVGYVDIQKAINECNAGKEGKKAIAKEVERFQRQAADRQKELQTMRESLEKQAPMLNAEARTAKENEFKLKSREFQRWYEDTQADIKQKMDEVERNISSGLQRLIQKVGADEGYTFILEKNERIVLFASKAIDLTDRVIKIFDTQKK